MLRLLYRLILWLLRPKEVAMPDAFSRPLSAIDGEIRSLLALNHDAEQQFDSIRRQQGELGLQEYNLVCAVDGRRAKVDRLLDERLRSVATLEAVAEALVTP